MSQESIKQISALQGQFPQEVLNTLSCFYTRGINPQQVDARSFRRWALDKEIQLGHRPRLMGRYRNISPVLLSDPSYTAVVDLDESNPDLCFEVEGSAEVGFPSVSFIGEELRYTEEAYYCTAGIAIIETKFGHHPKLFHFKPHTSISMATSWLGGRVVGGFAGCGYWMSNQEHEMELISGLNLVPLYPNSEHLGYVGGLTAFNLLIYPPEGKLLYSYDFLDEEWDK